MNPLPAHPNSYYVPKPRFQMQLLQIFDVKIQIIIIIISQNLKQKRLPFLKRSFKEYISIRLCYHLPVTYVNTNLSYDPDRKKRGVPN